MCDKSDFGLKTEYLCLRSKSKLFEDITNALAIFWIELFLDQKERSAVHAFSAKWRSL